MPRQVETQPSSVCDTGTCACVGLRAGHTPGFPGEFTSQMRSRGCRVVQGRSKKHGEQQGWQMQRPRGRKKEGNKEWGGA